MRLTKWLALVLALCMLLAAPTALSEDIGLDIVDANAGEDEIAPEIDLDLGSLDLGEDSLSLDLPDLEQEEISGKSRPLRKRWRTTESGRPPMPGTIPR